METHPPRPQRRPNSSQLMALGFLGLILAGAILLTLPFASQSRESIGFLNALFTATSASCVTGQIVVNTAAHWSWFGKIVIILLIQAGGLGVMTLYTSAILLLHRKMTLRNRDAIQLSFSQDGPGGMVALLQEVLRVTFAFESIGAALLTIGFYFSSANDYSFLQALIRGIFHSISAFCNAGFDIIGPDGMMPYAENPVISLTIMGLIISGGLGYPIWIELKDTLSKIYHRQYSFPVARTRLSVHAKIALSMTLFFTFGGALLFALLEWNNPETLAPLSLPGKILACFFQSVTLRTAGFNTINQGGLTEPSLFISCLLMFIGGSPAGTAGGIKTVTIGVVLFSMLSAVRGRNKVEAFHREISLGTLQKALAVISLLASVLLTGTIILCFSEANSTFPHTFLDLLFECSSVCATVGVTTGITPYLSALGKMVLIVCMFIGRIGPVTAAIALSVKQRRLADTAEVSLAQARVIIG